MLKFLDAGRTDTVSFEGKPPLDFSTLSMSIVLETYPGALKLNQVQGARISDQEDSVALILSGPEIREGQDGKIRSLAVVADRHKLLSIARRLIKDFDDPPEKSPGTPFDPPHQDIQNQDVIGNQLDDDPD